MNGKPILQMPTLKYVIHVLLIWGFSAALSSGYIFRPIGSSKRSHLLHVQVFENIVFVFFALASCKTDSDGGKKTKKLAKQVKLSFIVIPLHVWTYSVTRCRAPQDHGATLIQIYNTK